MLTAGMADPSPILFYDGVCGLCDRAVQFVLRHDRHGRFRFAALQSAVAAEVLERHGRDPRDLDTMFLLVDAGTPRERLLSRSDGVCELLRRLGGGWAVLALARVLPRGMRDRAYDLVARHRYRWFGRFERCALPPPGARERFLDAAEAAPQRRAGSG